MSKGPMPLDMVRDVPVNFAKELVSVVGEEVWKRTRSERHESLLRSEGERGVEAVGRAHATVSVVSEDGSSMSRHTWYAPDDPNTTTATVFSTEDDLLKPPNIA